MLKIIELTKKYDEVTALDHISFSVEPGKIVGLLGPNGAGKTTTINMILGILEPTSGTIEIFGKDTAKYRSKINEQINFAAVYAHVPPNLTVKQNLHVFGLLYDVENLKERMDELMDEFDLRKFADTKAGLLSSGELSRLNIAKAVINKPKLLLLDEPTASLDPHIAQMIRENIKAYVIKTNASIIWTSHNMHEVEDVCDEVYFLSKGKILLHGDPRKLPAEKGKKNLEELFISIASEPLIIEA